MAKIKYRECDICGKKIHNLELDIGGIYRRYINGCHLWNKLFNGIDICDDCADKIKYLSIDKRDEEKFIREFFENEKKYDNSDMQIAYYKGLDDALKVLSHNRLKDIKIPKR